MTILASMIVLITAFWPETIAYQGDAQGARADKQVEAEAAPQENTPDTLAAPGATPIEAPRELTTPPGITAEKDLVSPPKPALNGLAFADKSDEEVVALIVAHLESINTLNSKFYQQAPSGALSTGKLYIRRPGLMRFEYDPPTPLLIVANGGTVFVRDDALKTTDSYPVGRTPLKFLLRKKIDLGKADIINVERGPDAVALTLSAKDEETEGELSLIFSAPDIGLIQWVVRDPRNGLTIIDLTEVVLDEKLPNTLFRIPETRSPFLKN